MNITEIVDRITYEGCINAIKDNKWVAFDIETSGLDPRASDACVQTLQIGVKNLQFVLPLEISWSIWKGERDIQLAMLRGIAHAMKGRESCAHNGKFDISYLKHIYGVSFPLTFDTQVAAHLLDENKPTGLKYRAIADLGGHEYDIATDQKKGKLINPHDPKTKKRYYEYGCYDVFYTRNLALLYHRRLLATDGLMALFRNLMMPATLALSNIEARGFYIDRVSQAKVRKQLNSKIASLKKKLKSYADINWASPAQVGKFLFNDLGITPIEYTPKGAPSTSESVMKRLAESHPAPNILLQLRENQKLLSTYVGGYDERGEPFGWEALMYGERLYVSFKLTGTVTGRLSSRLHQVPRNKLIRSLISAPEGWTFWSADFSQIELRLAAWFSEDQRMLSIYKARGDIHLATAVEVLGVAPEKITDEERKMAKAVNFGLVYGMMPPKLVIYARDNYEISMSLSAAKSFRHRFFNRFSGLLSWHDRMKKLAMSEGQVRNPIGRIRRLPDIFSHEWFRKSEAERQAVNSPVQGFASDLKLMAMVQLEEELNPHECVLLGEHHDALLGMVKNSKIDKCMLMVKKAMEHPSLLDKFHVKIPVPIEVGIELGPWGTKAKWSPKK